MATMVQTPEIANTEISGLQAIQRPEAQSGLGAFLQGMLPTANAELTKYQDENRAKNIALGMNDQLNKVHREVSILDKRNYEYGHQYQSVQDGQATLQKQFVTDVDSIDTADPDAANKVFEIGRKYMDSTVENIHNSNLPTDLKESLYQSTLKENAVYQQMINKKLQQLTADAEYNTRLKMTSMLTRDLLTKEFDVSSLQELIGSFKEKVARGMRDSVVQVWDESTQRFELKQPSAADIQKETSSRLKAAFTHTLSTLKASGTAEDLERVQQLYDVADMLIDQDLDLATYVKGVAAETQAQVESNNDSYKSREVEEEITGWEMNPETLSKDVLDAAIAKVSADKSISIGAQTNAIRQYLNAYQRVNKAILSSKITDVSLYESPLQYQAIGKSEETWSKDWVAKALTDHNGDPTAAGYAIMVQGGNAGGVYSGTHVKAGSEIFFKSLIGSVSMTDAEAKSDEYYKYRQESFAKASALYKQYKQGNGSKAIDMLSGIDDKYRYAFEAVLDNGGTLAQVREAMKSPVAVSEKFKYYDTALDSVATSGEDLLNLRSGTLGGDGGRFGRNMADAIEDDYKTFFHTAGKVSKSHLVTKVDGVSPHGFLAASRSSLLMPSAGGYNSTITTAGIRKQMANYKVGSTGEPLHETYISKAIDVQREAIAKQYGTRPENMVVTIDDTGQVQFHAYKITKDFGGLTTGQAERVNTNANGLMSGGVVSMARIKADAEKLLRNDRAHRATTAGNNERISGTRIGQSVIIDRSSGSRRGIGVKVNGLYAEGLGGNVDLAKDWVNHMSAYEGFVSQPRSVTDQNTGKVSRVYAMGVTENSMGDEKTKQMFRAAAGDPQRLMDIQGGFMKSYYKKLDMPTMLRRAGVPAPTSGAYPTQFKRSLMLMYDAAWHGHRGALDRPAKGRNSLMEAMTAGSYSQGLALLKNTSIYDRKNPKGNLRNAWMVESLRQHYKAIGKL